MQKAFLVKKGDNVAVALSPLATGKVLVFGDGITKEITVLDPVPKGHKIAVEPIAKDSPIVKYHVMIGRATTAIKEGSWVHLHNMRSNFDERSSTKMDVKTGKPKDIAYD